MSVSSWQSIVIIIAFFFTTLVCVFPFHIPIPLPHAVGTLITHLLVALRVRPPPNVNTTATDLQNTHIKKDGVNQENVQSTQGQEIARPRRAYWIRIPVDFVTVPPTIVLLLLAMGVLSPSDMRSGIVGSGGVHPISIMALFLSLAYLSISLDATGLFRFLAFWVARKGGRSGKKLYLYLYTFFFICGVLVGNDPVILFGTPFLAYFSQVTGIVPPTAWIFGQFAVANIASAVLPPSNPTNLVISQAFDITFVKYPAYTVLPTIAAAFAVYFLIAFVIFARGSQIPKEIDVSALDAVPAVAEAEEEAEARAEAEGRPVPARRETEVDVLVGEPGHNPYAINDKHGALFGSLLFAITLGILVGTSPINVPVWEVTVPPAVVMLIRDAWHDRATYRTRAIKDVGVLNAKTGVEPQSSAVTPTDAHRKTLVSAFHSYKRRLPTVAGVLSRLPFSCVLFAFSMFILVQGLTSRGWVNVFAHWWSVYVNACARAGEGAAVVGSIGMMLLISVLLCSFCGTNIGTAILLARVIEAWLASSSVPRMVRQGSIFALAIGTNFGAVSFSFSASLAGLLWRDILAQKGIRVHQRQFALLNMPIVTLATLVAGAVLVAEMYVAVR